MKDYGSGAAFTASERYGWTCIEVLRFLVGRKWDEEAHNFIRALRPSSVRVSTGEIKSDARCWRVTVYVDKEAFIQRIEQEVEVDLVGWKYGADADTYLMGIK